MGRMKKKILLTTLTLLTATLGLPIASYAQLTQEVEAGGNRQVTLAKTVKSNPVKNTIKVGEYQSPIQEQAITKIQTDNLNSTFRQAATLYIRNIPVLTFVGNSTEKASRAALIGSKQVKVASIGKLPSPDTNSLEAVSNTPVERATKVAAKLNQLSQEGLNANEIAVRWKSNENSGDRYAVNINGEELVEINSETLLADTTKDPAIDALQVTNHLRRLLGNAPALTEITGQPQPQIIQQATQVVAQAVKVGSRGMASWYGPGFHGRRTANGERFNQNALTAAHRSLPFGTKVRVTNTRTGRSVVVRITDRGPFTGGRVIDLSAAAARIVGVMQSGVAPVSLEVLGR